MSFESKPVLEAKDWQLLEVLQAPYTNHALSRENWPDGRAVWNSSDGA